MLCPLLFSRSVVLVKPSMPRQSVGRCRPALLQPPRAHQCAETDTMQGRQRRPIPLLSNSEAVARKSSSCTGACRRRGPSTPPTCRPPRVRQQALVPQLQVEHVLPAGRILDHELHRVIGDIDMLRLRFGLSSTLAWGEHSFLDHAPVVSHEALIVLLPATGCLLALSNAHMRDAIGTGAVMGIRLPGVRKMVTHGRHRFLSNFGMPSEVEK